MNSYREFVIAQLEENLNLEIFSKEQFEKLKEEHLDSLSQKMTIYACNHTNLSLEEELAYFSKLISEVEQSVETEMRIVFKSRIPLPHLKQSNIIEAGLFNVGAFRIELDGKEANLDWDNTLITANFDTEDYLVLMANLFGELDKETYQELNEDVENLIPYGDIYSLNTLTNATFTEVSYEAYKQDYDGDIIPMDVVFVNFARVRADSNHALFGMGRVVEDINYDDHKLHEYNEREDVKWRLEGVKDPKTIHQSIGTYTSCLA